jgi:hypothetical protein
MELIDSFLTLTVQSRLHAAHDVYQQLIEYVNASEMKSAETAANDDGQTAMLRQSLTIMEPLVSQMNIRLGATNDALKAAAAGAAEDWILGTTYFGITTHYKQAADGCISVRLEGTLEGVGMVEQAAVIHEMDLFSEWIPFCNNSKTLTKLGSAELVGYLYTYLMPLGRDTALRAYGVDCLTESNKVVLVGNSVEIWPPSDPMEVMASVIVQQLEKLLATLTGCEISTRVAEALALISKIQQGNNWVETIKGREAPWIKPGWFHDRMDIRDFKAVMEMTTSTTAKVNYIFGTFVDL